MNPPDWLTTSRLVLRRPRPSDAAATFEYGRDPEVARYMEWPAHRSIDDAVAATEAALRRWESGDEFTWRIILQPGDDPVGAIACRVRGHVASIGFVVARQHWGHGFATEAAQAVVDWLQSHESIKRIWATCDVENAASARVLEKIGMSREGVLRKWAIRPNLPGRPARDCFAHSWVRESL